MHCLPSGWMDSYIMNVHWTVTWQVLSRNLITGVFPSVSVSLPLPSHLNINLHLVLKQSDGG